MDSIFPAKLINNIEHYKNTLKQKLKKKKNKIRPRRNETKAL